MNFNVQSIDDGFGDNKCASSGKIIRIPTAYADWRPLPKNDFTGMDISDKDQYSDKLYNYISINTDEGDFVIGETALKQDMELNWYGGDNKHEDMGFPIMMKTCLGLMADHESSVVDMLVMGLPCNKDTESRFNLLQKLIVKHHQMKLTLGDGRSIDRSIHVKNLIVKKQPFGSFCDILLDDEGNILDKELANSFNVIVDIGSRTLNIYTIDKMNPIDDLTTTTNNGMYTSYMRVGKFIERNLNFTVPTGKLPLVVKQKEINGYDLTPVILKSNERLAYEIKKVLDTLLVQSSGYINRIIFTGGGGEVLKQHLSLLFSKMNPVFLDRYATARGLRKYGLFRAKKLFDQQDNKITMRIGKNEYTRS